MIKITMLHNVARDTDDRPVFFDGYQPRQPLVPVFEIEWNGGDVGAHSLAEYAFAIGNKPEEFATGAERKVIEAYRARLLRSLSVGDVVQVGDDFLACQSVGFQLIDIPAGIVRGQFDDHGTHSLPAAQCRRLATCTYQDGHREGCTPPRA